ALGTRYGRVLVPGPNGVRPAGLRGTKHLGRPSFAAHASHAEPQNQVPGEFSAFCSCGPPRAGRPMVRVAARFRKPVHVAGGAGSRTPPSAIIFARTGD